MRLIGLSSLCLINFIFLGGGDKLHRYRPNLLCRVIEVFFWKGYSPCSDSGGQGNHFELIPTVKMETRRAVEGQAYFVSEFPAVCNQFGVTAV